MTAVTEADYAHLNWHQRQRLNDRLAAQKRALETDITELEKKIARLSSTYITKARQEARRHTARTETRTELMDRENAANLAEANRILAQLNHDAATVRPPPGSTRNEPHNRQAAS